LFLNLFGVVFITYFSHGDQAGFKFQMRLDLKPGAGRGMLVENSRDRPDHGVLTYLINLRKDGIVAGYENSVMENELLQAFATDAATRS
jgi:hypothetical protein